MAAEYCQQLLRLQIPAVYLDCIFESISFFYTSMEKSYITMYV
jgi:hypothetical protein